MLNNVNNQLLVGANDVSIKLDNSYIRYKGLPYRVIYMGEDRNIGLERPGVRMYVFTTDPELDFSSMRLGFCNFPRGALYVLRAPTRQFKYGIAKENVFVIDLQKPDRMVPNVIVFDSCFFLDMLQNLYPTYQQCLTAIDNGVSSIAFARKFALLKKNNRTCLLHKETVIGTLANQHIVLQGKYANSITQNILSRHGVQTIC